MLQSNCVLIPFSVRFVSHILDENLYNMKKTYLLVTALLSSAISFGQYNTDWYFPGISNSAPSGFIGIGTSTATSGTTPLPSFNFHVHGVANYTSSNTYSSFDSHNPGATNGIAPELQSSINYGTTARIGLTNSVTGQTDMEGAVLQLSQKNFYIKNQAEGDLTLSIPNFSMVFSNSTSRAWIGMTPSSSSLYGRLSMTTSDNGLYIRTTNTLRYGIQLKMAGDASDAIQVFGQGSTGVKNFKVSGGGEVFARKYTTTLNNIPDYVFAPTYNLMPLSELRSYIQTERHLPNIPSAAQYEEEGVDLGELNRLLLEKVEELTLYVLDLEERLHTLESSED